MMVLLEKTTVLIIKGTLTCWVDLKAISIGEENASSRNEKLLILT